jgi:hypothetical protein
MNPPRERSAIVAAWLEEGPTELPESTRRAIAVDVRTTRQSRRPAWAPRWFPRMDRQMQVALAAVVVVVVVIGAQAVSRVPSGGSDLGAPPPAVPSATPPPVPASAAPSSSPSPSPTTLTIPPMQQTFFSERHGYTVSYPAGWSSSPAAQAWWPPDWKAGGSEIEPFDILEGGDESPFLRAASAPLPTGLPSVDDWIDEFLTFGDPACVPPRGQQEAITIDGAPGRLRDSCGEVEATVVLDGRVYMFTLFVWNEGVTNGRELFDALAATIDLRPEDAVLPSPSLPGRIT